MTTQELVETNRDAKALASLLMDVYPNHQWNIDRLHREAGPSKSSQLRMFTLIQEIFPTEGKEYLFLK